MLDDMDLADRVKVAREWFRRAMTGEMPFDTRSAAKFAELLEDIERETVMQTARHNVLQARLSLLDLDAARHLRYAAEAAQAAPNVVILRPRPVGGAR